MLKRLVVGLGNPGDKYKGTRHNLGFEIVDLAAMRLGWSWKKATKNRAEVASGVDGWLMKPMTYMNLSGTAVAPFMAYYQVAVEEMLVVVDDIAVPIGEMRFRVGGGHGGHRGVANLINMVGAGFARLKLGVGAPVGVQVADFVLDKFSKQESAELEATSTKAIDLVEAFLAGGIEAVNRHLSLDASRSKKSSKVTDRESPSSLHPEE